MQSYKEQFIQGALNNKVSYKQAGELFDSMERFGGYGFNKSTVMRMVDFLSDGLS